MQGMHADAGRREAGCPRLSSTSQQRAGPGSSPTCRERVQPRPRRRRQPPRWRLSCSFWAARRAGGCGSGGPAGPQGF